MSEVRRDNKGRKLMTGESQDKSGRYRYKYCDVFGKRKSVYSWRLTESDPSPKGKKKDISLREKEKAIQRELSDGVIPNGGNMTVLELVQKYLSQKKGLKNSTLSNYNSVFNVIAKEPFGARRIDTVKLSDAKEWFINLQNNGRGYGSICVIRGIIKPAFQMAVDDDLIRKNPFNFQLATVITNNSTTREALTKEQERLFLEFIQNDKHYSKYYDGIYTLFKTGLRISEFCGLTINDIEFENHRIKVDHQLQRMRNMEYVILTPKTKKSVRYIPMQEDVANCFRRIIRNRNNPKVEPIINGYVGFLFLCRNNMPMISAHWEMIFHRICEKYNRIYTKQTLKVTPHICRHTFCSNMAKSGVNPKTLQYIMGHSDIGVTLNTYTHLQFEDVMKEVKELHVE